VNASLKRPYIIAEISTNHAKNIEVAKEIIEGVAKSGANAIKLQTFTAAEITAYHRAGYFIPGNSELWAGKKLWDLMEEAETPRDWHGPLFDFARSLGLDAFSTPYHPDAVSFLVDLGVDRIKISSFDLVNIPLIERVAETGLPVILSTGMAKMSEVEVAVQTLVDAQSEFCLMKCTSTYPCPPEDANLRGIQTLRHRFAVDIGFSDHTLGSQAAIIARVLGANIFEKHVRSRREAIESLDSSFSITTDELESYVREIQSVETFLGSSEIHPIESEAPSLWERPSLLALTDILLGETLTPDNFGVRRPSSGESPRFLQQFNGKVAKRNIFSGEGIRFEDFFE
jgi:sialic acid synthase SpsE